MITIPRRFALLVLAIVSLASVQFVPSWPAGPFSLSIPHRGKEKPPIWLIATMSAAHSQRRRNIIRATWQTYYHNPAVVTTRFVISNPEEVWMTLIQHENSTYGDLILMRDLEESAHVANTVKTIKFLTHLAAQGPSSQYKFVSKIADDTFLDVPAFYDAFIVARLHGPDNDTVIGRQLTHLEPRYPYPSGQFYTVSWNALLTLTRLFNANPIEDEDEDVLIGRLLYEGVESYEPVWLDSQEAFNLNEKIWNDGNGSHQVMEMPICSHRIKDDETYLQVAAVYG